MSATPGLGVGLDLPRTAPYGIVDGRVSPRTLAFLERHGHRFARAFVSWQPVDRGVPRLEDVEAPFQAFFDRLPHARRSLHQTALNLAGTGYDRGPLIDFTNALVRRFGFEWVNEDLGCWSVGGWSLPYPQPPFLTEQAVRHCAATCRQVDAALDVPLVVEFPGFEVVPPGELDAYAFFRQVIERSGCAATLDTGHLLTWRWLQGHRGEALLDDLDTLPLEHVIELHCAGVIETGDRLVDAHHGVLTELQLALVERLLARCPNLRVVTYEDPRFDDTGALPPAAGASLDALERQLAGFAPAPRGVLPGPTAHDVPLDRSPWEDALRAAMIGPDGGALRRSLYARSTRGLPPLRTLYGTEDDDLLRAFLASDDGEAWSDVAWAVPGRAIEDAFGRFVAPGSHAHLLAAAKLLALHPEPPFIVPDGFRRVGDGWAAVVGDPPHLYAAVRGQVLQGPIDPLITRLLQGERPAGSAAAAAKLESLGLLAAGPG